MILLRIIDFIFRLSTTILTVMVLQISVADQTLEDRLTYFIRHSESTKSIRDITYSNIKKLNLKSVKVPQEKERALASTESPESEDRKTQSVNPVSELIKIAISPSLARIPHAKKNLKKAQKEIEQLQKQNLKKLESINK